MIFCFFQVYVKDEIILIDNRKKIACRYLKGWFAIDLFAVLDFDIFLKSSKDSGNSTNANNLARMARIGRMYKLIKLTRLLRILKVAKKKGNLVKFV